MSVHVLVWFSVIWVLVLSQGNTVDKHGSTENGLDVSDVVLPGQPINRCDTRCFAKGKDGGPCFIHILSKKPILMETKKSRRVPNPPSKVTMSSDDTGALQISITSGREAFVPVGFMLVELVSLAESELGVYEYTQYLLLENNSSRTQFVSFSFQCSEIQSDIYEIRANVLALGNNKADDASENGYVFDNFYEPTSVKIFISEEYRRNKKIFNTCVCDSKVQTMRLYQDTKAGTIHGSVNVTQFPRGGQLEIILLRNSGITVGEAETWWRNGNGTYTVFTFAERILAPGIYNIKVKRHCQQQRYKISTKCGDEYPTDIVSKDLIVEKIDVRRNMSDARRNELSGSFISSPLRTSTKAETTRDTNVVIQFAVIVVSSFVLVVILIAGIIKLRSDMLSKRLTTDSGDHRESAQHLLPATTFSGQAEHRSVHIKHEADKKSIGGNFIPLIYTEDSQKHKDMVYKLQTKLEKFGVNALLVDYDNCPNVTTNWIDFAESLAKSYDKFIFIMSPLLFRLCHEGKHGNENSFESLLEKTKGIHLPPILLRNFEALRARNCKKHKIYLIELPKLGPANVSIVNDITEQPEYEAVPDSDTTPRVQRETSVVVKSPCLSSKVKAEGTLSGKLIDDYTILSIALCFKLASEDLEFDLDSRSKALKSLINLLK